MSTHEMMCLQVIGNIHIVLHDFRLMTCSVNAVIALAKHAYLASLMSPLLKFSVNPYKSPSGKYLPSNFIVQHSGAQSVINSNLPKATVNK